MTKPFKKIPLTPQPYPQKYDLKKIAQEYAYFNPSFNQFIQGSAADYKPPLIKPGPMKEQVSYMLAIGEGPSYKSVFAYDEIAYVPPPKPRTPVTPKPPPVYSPERLIDAALKASRNYGLSVADDGFAHAVPDGLYSFEVMAHEAIHSFLLEPGQGILPTDTMGYRIRDMPGWLANEHELTTLRIETIALGRYVRGLNIPWIYERANWRPPGDHPGRRYHSSGNNIPPIEKLYAPLTVAECAVANRFHEFMKEFL